MTREEYRKKLSRIIGDESSVIELMIDLDNVIKHDLPPAEGAEEMLKAVFDEIWDAPVPDDVFENPDYRMSFADAKVIAEKFATLHAQKIADKMVGDRLREELALYHRWIQKNKYTNIKHSHHECAVEYLKSRE